ncbi:MAG: hypothetical protein QW506_03515 [Thermoproteota archaeon]
MANLFDRELKLLFTSPLFIVLEFAPALFVAYVILYSSSFVSVIPLLPAVWLVIVFYSAFFELEIWRREFLNKGVKLKIFTNTSEYTPFLVHSFVSLILLELKTLIVLMSLIGGHLYFDYLLHFLLATHGYWLFSLSIGYILSKEISRKLVSSAAIFLCVLISCAVIFPFLITQGTGQSQGQSSFLNAFYVEQRSLLILVVLLLSLLLYVLALFACSVAARNIRIDDI